MRKIALLLFFSFLTPIIYGQNAMPERRFSPSQLKEDLEYLKQQLFNVHASPFTEMSEKEYKELFDSTRRDLTDSLSAFGFYRLITPFMAHLSDEHAQVAVNRKFLPQKLQKEKVFLPLVLSKDGKGYQAISINAEDTALSEDERITHIDNVPIAELIKKCSLFLSGFPADRERKATGQFGYLFTLSGCGESERYKIRTSSGKTVDIAAASLSQWYAYLTKTYSLGGCKEKISYSRYGDTGYINACSFNASGKNEIDSLKKEIKKIYIRIREDGINRLVIDVSRNGGGVSQIGGELLSYFAGKPFDGYGWSWRRSEEYLLFMKAKGVSSSGYESKLPGSLIYFEPQKVKPDLTDPAHFSGKVCVVVGRNTFSSAIIFATVIKDNKLALIAGETPVDGHPNHFGEVYSTRLPNTNIGVRFGVKQFTRPSGANEENLLVPDLPIDLIDANSPQTLIENLAKAGF